MNLEITVKNYRCFGDLVPARIKLARGTTALIGSNNSGKSTLLRFFYELRPLWERAAADDSACLSLFENGFTLPHLPTLRAQEQLFHRHNHNDLVIGLRILRPPGARAETGSGPDEIFVVISRKNLHCQARFDHETRLALPEITAPHFLDKWRHVFLSLSRTLYISPFRGFDDPGPPWQSLDLKGGGFPGHVHLLQQTDGAMHRVCEEIKSLFRMKSFTMRVLPGTDTLEFETDGSHLPLEELGSGLQQVIVILTHALLKKPDYILIDEPECHLHASLQADFVMTLNGFARKGLVFASHNIGLARSAGDRIYNVSRDEVRNCTTLAEYRSGQRLSETLGELNFSAQQQSGCTKLLLVEGPTEIKAIRQLLRKMDAEKNIVLLPLGGGSMIAPNRDDELAETKKICRDVYALIDSEKNRPEEDVAADRIAFRRSCEKNGIACHILERRSFENYFSAATIEQHYGRRARRLGPFDDVREIYPAWQKTDNWKLMREMPLEEMATTDLGRFLRFVVEAPCHVK